MNRFAQIDRHVSRNSKGPTSGKMSFLKFLFRYPIFLLAIGPPIFRANIGIDATKGVIDFWALFQVGWITLIAIRAMIRLNFTHNILILKPVQTVLRYYFILGFLFMASALYSPSRLVTAAYASIYFLTVICVVEFVVDAFKNPPDWLQCVAHVRLLFFLLYVLVLFTVPFNPEIVMAVVPGSGIRLAGGAIAPVTFICPAIAVISAYFFCFALESKIRSVFFFMIGLVGTMVAQSRGSELALVAALVLLGFIWASTGKLRSYLFIASTFASVCLGCVALAVVGGGRVWSLFNKGQTLEGIESASGRTDIWSFVFRYCLDHPFGMGYIAGFRKIFKQYFALGLQLEVTHIGNAHNSFMDVLADAGWPALAVYLILLFSVVRFGWRFARKRAILSFASDIPNRHALRLSLVLLFLCFADGMDTADFCVPLRVIFYFQNIVIAMILVISSRMLAQLRSRSSPSFK